LKISFLGGLDPEAPGQVFLFRRTNLGDFHGGSFMSRRPKLLFPQKLSMTQE
jgi:hypothetical protein